MPGDGPNPITPAKASIRQEGTWGAGSSESSEWWPPDSMAFFSWRAVQPCAAARRAHVLAQEIADDLLEEPVPGHVRELCLAAEESARYC